MTVWTLTSALLDVSVLEYAGLWRSTARDRFSSFGRLIPLTDGNLWGAKVEEDTAHIFVSSAIVLRVNSA